MPVLLQWSQENQPGRAKTSDGGVFSKCRHNIGQEKCINSNGDWISNRFSWRMPSDIAETKRMQALLNKAWVQRGTSRTSLYKVTHRNQAKHLNWMNAVLAGEQRLAGISRQREHLTLHRRDETRGRVVKRHRSTCESASVGPA